MKRLMLFLMLLLIFSLNSSAVVFEDFESVADWSIVSADGGSTSIQDVNAISGNAVKIKTDGAYDDEWFEIRRPEYVTTEISFWISWNYVLYGGMSGSAIITIEDNDTNNYQIIGFYASPGGNGYFRFCAKDCETIIPA